MKTLTDCRRYHGIFKDYPCLCEADSYQKLLAFAEAHDLSIEEVMRGEWPRLYKTYPEDGSCWVIQNPALIQWQMTRKTKGEPYVRRTAPRLLASRDLLEATLRDRPLKREPKPKGESWVEKTKPKAEQLQF